MVNRTLQELKNKRVFVYFELSRILILLKLRKRRFYPWRCLCLGFPQTTITLPLLRIKRQFSHIFRTELRTFIKIFSPF